VRRVVVLVHEARRTGPPVYALELVRWLHEHRSFDLSVVLLDGGELTEDFQRLVPTRLLDDPATPRVLAEADLVYVNTAASIAALRHHGVRPRHAVTHVHELEIGLRHYLPAEDYDLMVEVSERYVVGPEVARRNLVEGHGIPADLVVAVPYFPPRHDDAPAGGPDPRAVLGIGEDVPIVGACGSIDWRKGPDLFAQLAWELGRRHLPQQPHFAWVGAPNPSAAHWDAEVDLDLLGVGDRVHLVGAQADPLRWMRSFAVFAMTSRDDTFPLVCLEAASVAVPVVTFESGGIPDLVRDADGGFAVGFVDVTAMADRVEQLLADPGLRARLGRNLQDHVAEVHDLDRCAGRIADLIEELAG
jgi:glycosyltransferase involved in cell wall biosynthesis